MKKQNFLIVFYILNLIMVSKMDAQVTQEWVQRYNGSGNRWDEGVSMVVDASGNVYVTGFSLVNTNYEIATLKYNSSGVLLWSKTHSPGRATSIAVDNSGNVYVAGSENGFAFVTIKYSPAGDSIWCRKYSRTDANPRSICVDASGNVYVTGNVWGGPFQESDMATIKYNSSGVMQWVKIYAAASAPDFANCVEADELGNVYVTGWSTMSDNIPYDYTTIKYNSSGDEQWVKKYDGGVYGFDQAYSIAIDAGGNVYVTGSSQVDGTYGNNEYVTIKYDPSGTQQWIRKYNGIGNSADNASLIALDVTGNIYVTGTSYGGTTSLNDCATIKYNSNGDVIWTSRFDGTSHTNDFSNSLTLDNSGNVYIAGASGNDYLTVKYNLSGVEQWFELYNGPGNGTDMAADISLDNSGNVYITGKSNGGSTNDDYATIKYSQQTTQNLTLDITFFVEGFLNTNTNKSRIDTVLVTLRNSVSPFQIVDFAISVLDSNGYGSFNFSNAVNGTPYFIVVTHRNSIETWSKTSHMFSNNSLVFDFTSSQSQAYGDNLILKGSKYCVYSGDVNQDGFVDLTDITSLYNDASNFITGYVKTDLTGDNIVDLTDLVIAFNNSSNFVKVKNPIVGLRPVGNSHESDKDGRTEIKK